VLVVLGAAACGFGQEAKQDPAAQDYARAIAQAQSDLDEGRPTEARRRLEATNESQRSFEYEYLLARTQAATPDEAAPDLVRTVARLQVDTRYGVLNEANRQLVFICRDGSLQIHDLNAPDAHPETASHEESAIWSGAFSRDGETFAAGHASGKVVVWDAKTWKVRHAVSLETTRPVRELALAPDGSGFVAEGEKELELWSLAADQPKKIAGVGQRYNFGEGLAFSPLGDLVATGGMFDIVLHNAKTGEQTKSMRHASYTMGLEFSPDGKRIASAPRGNVNKLLAVFDVAEAEPRFNTGPLPGYITGLAFSPDGKRLAATGAEKLLRLFDTTTGEILLALNRPGRGANPAFSRDGRLLGWSEPDGYCFIELGEKPSGDK
jgi:WD40 repeat protein